MIKLGEESIVRDDLIDLWIALRDPSVELQYAYIIIIYVYGMTVNVCMCEMYTQVDYWQNNDNNKAYCCCCCWQTPTEFSRCCDLPLGLPCLVIIIMNSFDTLVFFRYCTCVSCYNKFPKQHVVGDPLVVIVCCLFFYCVVVRRPRVAFVVRSLHGGFLLRVCSCRTDHFHVIVTS